jgi:acetyl esterase/lipase
MVRAITSDDMAPELRDAFAKLPPMRLQSALFRRIIPLLLKLRPTPKVKGVTMTVPRGTPAMRIYEPEQRKAKGAILWIHGGGYIVGNASIDDQFCQEMSLELGVPVVSADYRLAPRHPFPAPLDDCHAVWKWMIAQAGSLGIDPDRIAIWGMSAGGGLAAALVQRICDEAGPKPVAQALFAPMLDDRTAARTELDPGKHLVWSNALNRLGWSSYLGQQPGAARVPAYAVPARREDLSGLPPAWIGVGSIELFHEEDVEYARRLSEAGVETALEIVPGAAHGFEGWGRGTEVADGHIRKVTDWLRSRI